VKYSQSIRTSMTTALSNCSRPVDGIYWNERDEF
jgi:hypothetical protein